jgi:hypothetical protein
MGTNSLGQPFLRRFNDDDEQISPLFFMDDTSIQFLRQCSVWVIDGTFHSAPKGRMQVLTVHGRHSTSGEYCPAAHIMMTGKTVKEYRTVFAKLNELMQDSEG